MGSTEFSDAYDHSGGGWKRQLSDRRRSLNVIDSSPVSWISLIVFFVMRSCSHAHALPINCVESKKPEWVTVCESVEVVSPPPAHALVEAEQRRIGPQRKLQERFAAFARGEWGSLFSQSEETAKSAAAIRQRRQRVRVDSVEQRAERPNRWRSWASCHSPGWHWTEPVVRLAMNRRSEPSGTRADVLFR